METNGQTNEENPSAIEAEIPQVESELMEFSQETQRTDEDLQSADSNDQVQNVKPKRKMNGAQKKRYAWLMKNGTYTPEEAYQLSKEPMAIQKDTGKKEKRALWDQGITVPEAIKRMKSEVEEEPNEKDGTTPSGSQLTSKNVDESVKLGIVHGDYPEELSNDQMDTIQEAILTMVVEEEDESKHPCFHTIHKKQGYLLLTCQDEATAEWLKSKQELLKPWEGAILKVVQEAEIPRTKILTAYFPNSLLDPNEKILKLIQVQNKGLNATEWRVLKRINEKSDVLLTLAVDSSTKDKLAKEKFKINFKFGKVNLKLKNNYYRPEEASVKKERFEKKWGGSVQYSSPGTSVGQFCYPNTNRQQRKAARRGFGARNETPYSLPFINGPFY